jgi:hypothetical protein
MTHNPCEQNRERFRHADYFESQAKARSGHQFRQYFVDTQRYRLSRARSDVFSDRLRRVDVVAGARRLPLASITKRGSSRFSSA